MSTLTDQVVIIITISGDFFPKRSLICHPIALLHSFPIKMSFTIQSMRSIDHESSHQYVVALASQSWTFKNLHSSCEYKPSFRLWRVRQKTTETRRISKLDTELSGWSEADFHVWRNRPFLYTPNLNTESKFEAKEGEWIVMRRSSIQCFALVHRLLFHLRVVSLSVILYLDVALPKNDLWE